MKFLRSSALTLAVGYISLGLAALALFAAPLWYAWRVTIEEGATRSCNPTRSGSPKYSGAKALRAW